ncbi:TonB-dependent receptor [Ichthyenterobacterium sp. W332]|uniref:TonB-dependent receptor n=1 Tax=Microcosmobacter mediterraneus TaxID=3075607 RepID=A0ABU2YJI7_9FLAO|nr:TonB-dependent receptor [Ichthyenterobacterium sp. W332]MDT0557395.1 TonB-dependent receptor [Ichthyenterobacterium sp. W332]
MKHFALIIALIVIQLTFSQNTVSGKVTDSKGQPLEGANVYIEGTYNGTTTNPKGEFSFTTEEKETQVLIVSFLSYETATIVKKVSEMKDLNIRLREDVDALDTVILSAGTFEANDNSKVSVLKPLDVVTTASALGDFVGALQTLPGTTTVAEDGRLFVRGGDADETQIFIDGIRVFTPYSPTTNNIPTRGRYSPFLFDGITFSTGGYSAEYGQALSSVLLLNTIDEPDQEKTDIGIMSVGGSLGNTQKWEKTSLSINASYINLAPYLAVYEDRNDWKTPYRGAQGEAVFRQKLNSGMLKFYAAFDASDFELTQEDINLEEGLDYKLNNTNFYTNASYQGVLNNGWSMLTGLSYTNSNTRVGIIDSDIKDIENSVHAKLKFKKRFSSRLKLNFGVEHFITDFEEEFSNPNIERIDYGFTNHITSAFAESDIIFSTKLALKAGVRGDYYNLFNEWTIAPRVSLAYKSSKNGQVSLAYGNFFQRPTNASLKFSQNLAPQNAEHFILNYQYVNDGKIFRLEAYKKVYDGLVKFDTEFATINSNFNNSGNGFAQGIDLFWRDNKSIKNVDYWFSYSYLDTERNYLNYPESAQPNFANTHNLSLVAKYWIENWKSQIGFSYQYGSGRPFTNPNTDAFLGEKTKGFNSLSLNWAYLLSQQKILYMSVNNVLGFNNINGYQYANSPDINGTFNRRALRPAADQFFFIGFFWTISEDGKDNQLDNL